MASRLPHPSSSEDFRKFRDRIRQSPPKGKLDKKWLMDYLGFTQPSNAGTFLSALEAAGFVKDEALSDRGLTLLTGNDSADYHQAMHDAVEDYLGKELADSIRSGAISKDALPGYLQRQAGVGSDVVQKFFWGLRWLAIEAGEDAIAEVCPAPRVLQSSVNGTQPSTPPRVRTASTPTKTKQSKNGSTAPVEVKQQADTSSFQVKETGLLEQSSQLLNGQVLQVRLESSSNIVNSNKLLRWLQMIERGELIPEENDLNGANDI
jgi:hypothetical protein